MPWPIYSGVVIASLVKFFALLRPRIVATMVINNDMAALIGFGCEAFLYGCYTVLFVVSVYLMRRRSRGGSGFNRPIFIISIFLYFSCAAHFALEFNHFNNVLAATGVDGFANETNVLVGADILISVTDFFGELILIYRCWLLWSRNYWIIILPSLTSIGGLACVGMVIHLLLSINPSSPIAPPSLVPLGLAGIVLPLCTNVFVTALIAARIWLLSPRKVRDLRGVYFPEGTGRMAIDIVIESGALYLVVQLVFVVLFAIRHPAQGIVCVIAVQIYVRNCFAKQLVDLLSPVVQGIAPALIIIRVALGLSNTVSERPGARAASWSQSSPTEVRIGYSTAAFTDAGQRISPVGVPMAHMKSRPDGEDFRSICSSTEHAV
ncbi:hypothetical protein EDB92DRAFT_1345213 [Lactarius akahatsu]|uniref:Uncharacterized protein n=1 Tax=Lactarius akahatsu TaxID=416441 RepID=A0AAD4LBQ3_9AGAM|nr:hypothetical protein EDB92DRAFT_1345213 [Lactarius akahatsu]